VASNESSWTRASSSHTRAARPRRAGRTH